MYWLDIAQMALWTDAGQTKNEQLYLEKLKLSFGLYNNNQIIDNQLNNFILKHKNNLPFF